MGLVLKRYRRVVNEHSGAGEINKGHYIAMTRSVAGLVFNNPQTSLWCNLPDE